MNEVGLKIVVAAKNRYGTWFFYPLCERSKIFVQMIGGKTLTTQSLGYIKKMGYDVEVKTDIPTIPNL